MGDRRSKRVVGLAASFVVTVGGCKDRSMHVSPATLYDDGTGHCAFMHGFSCPQDATCNPPPPNPADCPGVDGSGGIVPPKPGWVRVKESFYAGGAYCSFVPDYRCPLPGKAKGQCEARNEQRVACTAMPNEGHRVEAFVATRAGGVCAAYPAFQCKPGDCKLPTPTKVACGSTPPVPTPVPQPIATATGPTIATGPKTLNPVAAGGRPIRKAWNGDGCFVYMPFGPLKAGEQRPPGSEPPREPVTCPPLMNSEPFASCRGGVVMKAGDTCECAVPGNPPPPPRPVSCP